MPPDAVEMLTDEDLLARTRRGEHDAFRELIERHRVALHGYLVRYLGGDRHRAEDLFQETWLRVHQNAWRFHATLSFRTWLYTIASNGARDELRRRRTRAQGLEQIKARASAAAHAHIEPAPLDGLIQRESLERLKGILDQLSQPLRETLLLYFYQELPQKEIAHIQDIPVGTVKSRIHNAIEQLLAMMQPTQSVEPAPHA